MRWLTFPECESTRKGFTKWKHAPWLRPVEEWAEKDPTANVVYVPGLCRTERGGDPIVVVDSEDEATAQKAERRCGRTPGMVKTRRGYHALYRDAGRHLAGEDLEAARAGLIAQRDGSTASAPLPSTSPGTPAARLSFFVSPGNSSDFQCSVGKLIGARKHLSRRTEEDHESP